MKRLKTIEIPIEDPQSMADRLRDDPPIYDEDYVPGTKGLQKKEKGV